MLRVIVPSAYRAPSLALTLVVSITCGATGIAHSQNGQDNSEAHGASEGTDQLEAPSGYVEEIQAPTTDTAEEEAEATTQERATPASSRGRQVEEIVVRARKREELLQDTPLSITALSHDTHTRCTAP